MQNNLLQKFNENQYTLFVIYSTDQYVLSKWYLYKYQHKTPMAHVSTGSC